MTDRTRLLVLVLPVLLGLLGMHALAAPSAHSGVHDRPAVTARPAPHSGLHSALYSALHSALYSALRDGPARAAAVPAHPVPDGASAGATRPDPHGSSHDGAAHLLHPCLAVLVAGVVLAVAVLLPGWAPLPAWRWPVGPGRPRTGPTGRPPPVPRRLALLCVSRT